MINKMNYGYYIAIGFIAVLFLVFLLIIFIRLLKKRKRISGEIIEQSIDDKLPINLIVKKANFFAKDKKFSHAIIYLFYIFRIYCEENYKIKNARVIDHNELVKKLAGFSEISIFDLEKILKIYEKARFTKEENFLDEFIALKSFLTDFMLI